VAVASMVTAPDCCRWQESGHFIHDLVTWFVNSGVEGLQLHDMLSLWSHCMCMPLWLLQLMDATGALPAGDMCLFKC